MNVADLFQDLAPRRWETFVRRFRSKIVPGPGGCLLWTGEKHDEGYGRVTIERKPRRHRFMAHRVSYEIEREPVPDDLTIDHTCRVRLCVNPEHLEIVTLEENTRREMAALHGSDPGVRCKRGHVGEYRKDPKSQTYYCRGCARENARRYYHESN